MEPEILSLAQKLDPRQTAVVVIDIQNDFCHAKGAVALHAGKVNQGHNREAMQRQLPPLLEAARRAGAMLVFVKMINDPVYQSPPNAERLIKLGIYGKGLMEGTWGADYWEEMDGLGPREGNAREIEVEKHRYSAFIGTNLDQVLRSNGIKTIVYTGLATSGCVESTARDGLFFDYYGVMASDCVSDGSPDNHNATLRKYAGSFGEVMTSQEIMGLWQAAASKSTGKSQAARATGAR